MNEPVEIPNAENLEKFSIASPLYLQEEQQREARFIQLYRKLCAPAMLTAEEPSSEVTTLELEEYIILVDHFKHNGRLEQLKSQVNTEKLV